MPNIENSERLPDLERKLGIRVHGARELEDTAVPPVPGGTIKVSESEPAYQPPPLGSQRIICPLGSRR